MDGYLAVIKLFSGTFAPKFWALCDGAELQIAQYDNLFAIIGTQYGGDGRTTFCLPNLADEAPKGGGNGDGMKYIICIEGMLPYGW